MTILRREAAGTYVRIDRSDAFPELTADLIDRFVRLAMPNRQFDAIVAFRDWLRENPG